MDEDEKERLEGEAHGVFHSIQRALAAATPGETILLGPGHYWEQDLVAAKGVQLVGDASDAARVVVELTGTLDWRAPYGIMTNLTIRRPRRCKRPTPAVVVGSSGGGMGEGASGGGGGGDAAAADAGAGAGLVGGFGSGGSGRTLYMHGCVVNNEGGGGGPAIVVEDNGRVAIHSCQVAHSDSELGGVVVHRGR